MQQRGGSFVDPLQVVDLEQLDGSELLHDCVEQSHAIALRRKIIEGVDPDSIRPRHFRRKRAAISRDAFRATSMFFQQPALSDSRLAENEHNSL